MNTFDDFRAKISIGEMAEHLGYWKNPSGGKAFESYCFGERNNPSDEIVIYNPTIPAKNTYFSRKGGVQDKGNLINFVLNRLNRFNSNETGFKAVNEVLGKYINSEDYVIPSVQKTSIQNPSSEHVSFNLNYWNPRPLEKNGVNYLLSRRKLSQNTINDFRNKLLIYSVGKSEHVGFPFRHPGKVEITNFEMRNFFAQNNVNYKGFCTGGNKSTSCWIGNFVPFDKVKDLYIFESAIDAMSFYELNNFSNDTTSAFVSTGGHVTKDQITSLQKVFQNVNWNLCNDNDGSGNAFDITIAFILNGQDCKAYTKALPEGGKMVHICLNEKEEFSFLESEFSSKEFLLTHHISNVKIIKSAHGKDWNEQLIYGKRFNTTLNARTKISKAMDRTISQIDLRGYHSMTKSIYQQRKNIISQIIDNNCVNCSMPLSITSNYILQAECLFYMKADKFTFQINDLKIYNNSSQSYVSATPILNKLRAMDIAILGDIRADNFETLLSKGSLTVNKGNSVYEFARNISPLGWELKENIPLKKKELDLGCTI